jgi:hypothetical protein
LILAPLLFAECLALELSGASFAAVPTFGDSLVLPAWVEPLIAALRWGWNIGLCRSIHFTRALANAPPLLTNLLVELLTTDRCGYLWRSFVTVGAVNTGRHYVEHIAINPVSYSAGSHHFPVDIPAPLEARPPNWLLGPPGNLGKIRSLIEYHHVIDVGDFRHVYRVVDDRYVLPCRHNIGSKPSGTEMPDRTKVVVVRAYAEAHVNRRPEP